jgi:plasmid maintenance system antidote protein VapI
VGILLCPKVGFFAVARYIHHTREEVIAVIPGSHGITVEIAHRLNVSRQTVLDYFKRWPTVKEAYEQEVQTVGDKVETNLFNVIYDDDKESRDRQLETSKWYARVKLRERGYADSVNVRHSGDEDKPVVVKHVGAAELVAAERAFLAALGLERPGLVDDAGNNHPPNSGADIVST